MIKLCFILLSVAILALCVYCVCASVRIRKLETHLVESLTTISKMFDVEQEALEELGTNVCSCNDRDMKILEIIKKLTQACEKRDENVDAKFKALSENESDIYFRLRKLEAKKCKKKTEEKSQQSQE